MRGIRFSLTVIVSSFLLIACGSDSGALPDGSGNIIDAEAADADTTTDADLTLPDSPPPIDAPPPVDADTTDAVLPACNPTGDYLEASDSMNDLLFPLPAFPPEATGQSIGNGGSFTIGGCIDPTYQRTTPNASYADVDFFEFTVAANATVRIEFVHSFIPQARAFVAVYRQGNAQPLDSAWGDDGSSVIGGVPLTTGTYRVGVYTDGPFPTGPYDYQILVSEYQFSCANATGAPNYAEADESGSGHRDNDYITIPPPGPTAANDSPEATGIVTNPAAIYHLRGNTADVASDGDSYLDRDSFRFTTDANTETVDIRLTWPDGDVDMDLVIFREDELLRPFDRSLIISTTLDERAIVGVDPNTTYIIWAATFDDSPSPTNLPLTYDITMCVH